MYALFQKEITGFFHTLSGYVVIILFLVITGLFLWVFDGSFNILQGGYATLEPMFALAPWVFLFLIPAVTMKSFAEERRTGTLELLLTRPLSLMQIVFAKYMAAMTLVVAALIPTGVYYASVWMLGNPPGNIDHGGTWGSYIGLVFLAGAYAAVGIFCSSLTDNLVLAFLLAASLCLFICFGFEETAHLIRLGTAGKIILSVGMIEHYRSMSRGVIDTRDIVYFVALIALFNEFTRYRLARHRA